jgi:DNA-binding transcriptional LysR family regulator
MDLRHLRYFLAITDHGSITAAATSLGIRQSSLSDTIRALEEELGVALFMRHARGVRLTQAGDTLAEHARLLLSMANELPQQLRNLRDDDVGAYVIGCYESLGAWYLPRVFAHLNATFPGIRLDVVNTPSLRVEQAVIDRVVHLGLVVNARPHPDLVITPVCNDVIELVAHHHRVQSLPAELLVKQGPLFYLDRTPFDDIVARLGARGLLPERRVAIGDLELVKAIVSEGVGVGILPRRVAQYGGASPLVPIDRSLPRFDDTIHLIMRYDLPKVRALKTLRDLLITEGTRRMAEQPIDFSDEVHR